MFSYFLENVIMMLWKHQKFTVFKDVLKHLKKRLYFSNMFLMNILKTYFYNFCTTFHVFAEMF